MLIDKGIQDWLLQPTDLQMKRLQINYCCELSQFCKQPNVLLIPEPRLAWQWLFRFPRKECHRLTPDTLLWGQVICNRREQGTLTLGSELGSEHDLVLATVGLKGFPFKPVLYLDLKQHNIKLLISKLNMLVFTSQAWKKDPVNREHNERLISKFKPFQVATVFFDTEVNLLTARYGLPFTSFHITSNVTHLKTWKTPVK